ncbi:MAG TPA: NBR1-Ig-like domain-containing protein, partial [Anaerolineales bacterium]|nr:NBR1-Ig-like domain-containing protein [Anaerolineales bacterium]
SETPSASATPSPTQVMSPTPTLFGPYVSTTVNPQTIYIDETSLVSVSLNNVPAAGYTSSEFTCSFDASIVEVSNIVVTDLFGADAAVAINGPQNNTFIIAIAGSNGNKATTSGTVFTFDVKGLQVGQTNLGCEARVSTGDNVLTQIPSARTFLTVLSTTDTPTPNLTPGTPTVQPSACDRAEFIADVNVPPGTVMSPAATFTKTWRLKNLGPCTWTTSYSLVFFHGDMMGALSSAAFTQSVAVGETVDISINLAAPNAPGSYRGYWMFRNSSGINFGIGPDANQPWFVDINVSGPTLPPSPTSTPAPSSPTPTITSGVPTATETSTPGGGSIFTATPTSITNDWLTFTNSKNGFEFK